MVAGGWQGAGRVPGCQPAPLSCPVLWQATFIVCYCGGPGLLGPSLPDVNTVWPWARFGDLVTHTPPSQGPLPPALSSVSFHCGADLGAEGGG